MPSTSNDRNHEHQQDQDQQDRDQQEQNRYDRTQHGEHQHDGDQQGGHRSHGGLKMYWRFAAMILTAMVVMYATMFIGSWEWSHVRWSENRLFMTLTMGGTMVLVMLAWMLNMYQNTTANVAVVVVGLLMLGGGAFLDRSQTTVQDTAYMSSMIPHHSLAITRSERAELADVRVCQLAAEISEAQRREIDEMDWLIADIETNGVAETVEQAQARPVPDYPASALRQCPGE
ncbi:DUF305 domain-containing protein [Kocuria oceani]|uniref:DUF305 domain-containing protein n=1 Tax=Kocuria oceani TaxID=988827 RepID=UPI0040369CAA